MCSTSTDDLDGLSDGELLEHVRGLVAEQNRVAARLARAVRVQIVVPSPLRAAA